MQEISEENLKKMEGGSIWVAIGITAAVIFIVGVLDGFTRPLSCND